MPPKSFSTLGAIGGGSAKAPPAPATVTTHPAPPAPATATTHPATPVAATGAASKATCKFGDKCYGCKICGKSQSRGSRGNGGGGKVDQLSSEIIELKKQLDEMKSASASTDARLGKVEKDVVDTNDGVKAILAMMREDRKQPALPPLPARPAIMPPSSTLRSQSPPTRMELVTSGPEGSFGKEYGYWVPQWGSSKTTSTSSGSYTGQNGWADKAVAGGGAMVVSKPTGTLPSPSSLPGKGALPSPSSLAPKSDKKSGGMSPSGSGLVRCSDQNEFLQALQNQKWNQMMQLLQSSNSSVHLLTAAVNAYSLSQTNEAVAIAIACFDRARPVSAFEPYLRNSMRAAFDPDFPAFKQFCLRMAEFCSKSPGKGIKYCDVTYPYAHLAQNDEHRKQLIAALRDN